jgi:hypothetical protein
MVLRYQPMESLLRRVEPRLLLLVRLAEEPLLEVTEEPARELVERLDVAPGS